jgi:hypothetical protein
MALPSLKKVEYCLKEDEIDVTIAPITYSSSIKIDLNKTIIGSIQLLDEWNQSS